ncbi:hypothetical protein C8J56DRAFT_1062158 [Mycena floridula]|nr:hypothetical protein C8J56DRAFT_1062117 [Mycena floridula]KAJ7576413.1 hypothetical protein C8J56DRAFT_1062119 [Mycena floridula]KAJ7576450.1 hypothetical protein C8J56DRAFT_1062158 [Mycena floridula]
MSANLATDTSAEFQVMLTLVASVQGLTQATNGLTKTMLALIAEKWPEAIPALAPDLESSSSPPPLADVDGNTNTVPEASDEEIQSPQDSQSGDRVMYSVPKSEKDVGSASTGDTKFNDDIPSAKEIRRMLHRLKPGIEEFYVVTKGWRVGVFLSSSVAQQAISNVAGFQMENFGTAEAAADFYEDAYYRGQIEVYQE